MKSVETLLICIAWGMAGLLWHTLVYNGVFSPPKGRIADAARLAFLPIHLLLVWNPYPPIARSRISTLMYFAARNPKRALKLVTARNDVDTISNILAGWDTSWPLDAEFSVALFHWLKQYEVNQGESASDYVYQPCMRLVRALTESSALAELVPALMELAEDNTKAISRFDVEYGIASSRALSPEVLRAVPCRVALGFLAYARPNYHGIDPLAEIFPDELPHELMAFVKSVCWMFPHMTFGQAESLLRSATPLYPGWSLLASECVKHLDNNMVGFPEVLVPEFITALAPLNQFADSITAIANLKRAGAPGDITELAHLTRSLELS